MIARFFFTHRFAAASLALFLVHLPLLAFVRGEFTDGVLQVHYFDPPLYQMAEGAGPARYVPPLYPLSIAVLRVLHIPPLMAGRLVSTAAYAATAWVLAWIALRAASSLFPRSDSELRERLAWVVWAFWALSPMANRWSFHAMTDMPFCFLSTLSLALFLESSRAESPRPMGCWMAGNLAGVLAALTRFQGFALAGVAVFALLIGPRARHSCASGARWTCHPAVRFGATLGVWTVTLLAVRGGGAVHGQQFADRFVYPWEIYRDFALAGFRYLPDAVSPPLLLLAIGGLWVALRSSRRAFWWIGLGLMGGLAGLAVQTFFLSFQFRYGLPLLPWVCLLAAVATLALPAGWKWFALGATLVCLVLMTSLVYRFQPGTFSDIEQAAAQVREHLEEGQSLWAFEEYNPTYRNVKVSAWSGVPARWLDEESLLEIREGDLLLVSNVYLSRAPDLLDRLREKWRTQPVFEAVSESLPLFPGEPMWVTLETPQGPRRILGASDPNLLPHRFQKQVYETVLYRLQAREP
jgi:4-amino-4-deoxy-L-arabinose transferase-like glycosyltransferase